MPVDKSFPVRIFASIVLGLLLWAVPALQASASQPFADKIADIDDGNAVHTDVTDVDRCGRAVGIAPVPRATILNHKLLKSDMARPADASPALPWEYRNADRSEGVLKVAPSASSGRMYAAAKERYSGNTSSGIFHRSSCRYYNCKRCTAHFSNRNAAIQAGYRPCKICKP